MRWVALALAIVACGGSEAETEGASGSSGASSSAGTGGTGGATAPAAVEGGPCSTAGALGCTSAPGAPPASFNLRCAAGVWVFHSLCGEGTQCNHFDDATHGQCLAPAFPCNYRQPGERICTATGDAVCKNAFTLEKVRACGPCKDGECITPGDCVDGSSVCADDKKTICQGGTWVDGGACTSF